MTPKNTEIALPSIALIDDNKMMRQAVRNVLSTLGFSVMGDFSNGKVFLESLADCLAPDICLLDINMPVMNGFETAVALKKGWPGMKIIVFSLQEEPISVERMNRIGVDAYLCKRCEAHELKNMLMSVRK